MGEKFMRDPKYLSNKELVDELRWITSSLSETTRKRKKELFDEVLRRLNEPWRNLKCTK